MQKKLKQIEELKAKQGAGTALDADQLEKVAAEASVRAELAAAESGAAKSVRAGEGAQPHRVPGDVERGVRESETRNVKFPTVMCKPTQNH